MKLFYSLIASLVYFLGCAHAADAPLRVSFLSGDTQSAAAVAAVKELQADPLLAGIEFQVYPDLGIAEAERDFLRQSDLLIIASFARTLAPIISDDVRAVVARGGKAYALGSSMDPFIELGASKEDALNEFFVAGGKANLAQMLRAALAQNLRPKLTFTPPVQVPEKGYFEARSGAVYTRFEDYIAAYLQDRAEWQDRPWVGIVFSRNSMTSGETATIAAIVAALEARGLNVLPSYSYPVDKDIETLFLDDSGYSRIEALVALSLKLGIVPDKIVPKLKLLDVPVINAISLFSQTRAEWEASKLGLDLTERAWQINGPEQAGAVAPTVVASKETIRDSVTGMSYVIAQPIPERVERLAARVQKWVNLRTEPVASRQVAVMYYNYLPPGPENVGASYLNVLPQSLWQILSRLRADGYDTSGAPESEAELFSSVRTYGLNPKPGTDRDKYLNALVKSGRAHTLPVSEYRVWFDQLPQALREVVIKEWGQPEDTAIMVWRDPQGVPSFVFPGQRWGNVFFGPQPTRGWEQNIDKVLHSVALQPHHQYLAFYLWLQKGFQTDAMVHVGTHDSHEWQPGKEVGNTAADPGEVLVADVPQVYPYIVDDIGEGLQAKRRGMATIISHMTPPLDRASLNPELRELKALMGDHEIAHQKGGLAEDEILKVIAQRAEKMGVFKDLSFTPGAPLSHEQLHEIEEHIGKIGEKFTPFGLHTFGVPPNAEWRARTAEAVLFVEPGLKGEERELRKQDLMARMEASGRAELDALSAGLAGRYVAAGPGNDPMRTPDSLPTGKNFYGFDPSRLPTPITYKVGTRMATNMIEEYRGRHAGEYPDRLVFTLFDTETNRHEGVIEGQILALMGVRPQWNPRGQVIGVELISREELGRPRVDVTITPSGLYRDTFSQLLLLLDEAVSLVKTSEEADNPIRRNIAATRAVLEARGVAPLDAERFATVRIFAPPPGVYSTNIANIVQADEAWDDEKQVADVYFNRMSHLFGQGLWGERPTGKDGKDLGVDIFRSALKDAKAVIHSRSGNIYATLDNDDFYQYLGGSAIAVRQVSGKTPEVLVADLSDRKDGETVTLERFMGQEMRARYLNPSWVKSMLAEGYAGGRFIRQVVDNLWGWQVTAPEAVDATKWQEMFEIYVNDRHDLGVREKLGEAGNLGALKAIVERMLVAVDKGYWDAPSETLAKLREVQAELIPEVIAEQARLVEAQVLLQAAPAAAARAVTPPAATQAPPPAAVTPPPAAPAAQQPPAAKPDVAPAKPAEPTAATQTVEGRTLEEVSKPASATAADMLRWSLTLLTLLAGAFLLFGLGWWRQGRSLAVG